MILDKLESAETYFGLHAGFRKAFDFLHRADLISLDASRYLIDGEAIYALVQSGHGKERNKARLEAHRNYIDIQFLIDGNEQTGWSPRDGCRETYRAYDSERDIEFFSDSPQTYLTLKPGTFAIFFPADPHAPMISEGNVHKCVVKVRVA